MCFRKMRSGVHKQKKKIYTAKPLKRQGKMAAYARADSPSGGGKQVLLPNRAGWRWSQRDIRSKFSLALSLRSHWTHGKGKALACIHIEPSSKPTASAFHYTCRRNRPTASDQTWLWDELFTSEGRNGTQVKMRTALAGAKTPQPSRHRGEVLREQSSAI